MSAVVRALPDERLALARGVLAAAEQRRAPAAVAAGTPTDAPADGAPGLPVAAPLRRLLPSGLRCGSTVAIPAPAGATSLLFALLAEASAGGSWIGVAGRPDLGVVAAAEAGLALERLALVAEPGPHLVAVVMALLDGMDVVVVGRPEEVRAAERQRLAARARQRGAVLVALGPWPGAEIELSCAGGGWQGLDAEGGRLRARPVVVRRAGRGAAARLREVRVLLPGPAGRLDAAPVVAPVPIRTAS